MGLFSSNKHKKSLGIYIHVPFCVSKCGYCDFYSLPCPEKRKMHQYVRAVKKHIAEAGDLVQEHLVDTVYFGGGTPSYLGAEGIADILNTLRKHFLVSDKAEITVEVNPDSVDLRKLKRLWAEGVNRISMGIQSDNDEMLEKIGRPHTYGQAVYAAEQIRRAGFRNLSIDLMYGLPGQTLDAWKQTVEHVLSDIRPEHISCYGLRLEEGTPMWALNRSPLIPDDDTQADMYLAMVTILRHHNFAQYEISNFSRRGMHSKHNLRYWEGKEYLGFGPAASSDFDGKRFSAVADLDAYCEGVLQGGQVLENVQEITPGDRATEYLMLRLRTSAGISREEYEETYHRDFGPVEQYLAGCAQRGTAVPTRSGRWRLTPRGFLISNAILSDLMLITEQ